MCGVVTEDGRYSKMLPHGGLYLKYFYRYLYIDKSHKMLKGAI